MEIKKSFTLTELASITHSKMVGDPQKRVCNIADLRSAESDDVSFLANSHYEKAMRTSKAGIIFVSVNTALDDGKNYLINDDPSRAYQQVVEIFLGDKLNHITGFSNIHPSATIHEKAKIDENATIAPHVVIDEDVSIGKNALIGASTYIGKGVSIGDNVHIHAGVIIRERCQIGNNVTLQPGAIIGSCGFGYTTDAFGVHTKLNQVGVVIIEDDVEIGANTTIDRARFNATIIGKGTKIDNLVQIGHGVKIGHHCIIVAQTGIAGSTELGNHVVVGGQTAIAGHLKIVDQVMIAGRSGITKSILKAGKYGGVPALPINEHNRVSIRLRNIESTIQQINDLEKRISMIDNFS